jgi:alkylation response protein AidB-like acyl-CoA dehydrogenase
MPRRPKSVESLIVLDPDELSRLADSDLRSAVRTYLHGLLPFDWLRAVERDDREALRAERNALDRSAWWKALASSGLAAPRWPVGSGGLGLSAARAKIVTEELNRVRAPYTTNPVGIGLVGPVLLAHGTEDQKNLLVRIAAHEDMWCELFSEPGAGSDLASLSTRAVRDGEEWIVNGQKVWSSLAHESQWGLLLARTNPNAEKHAGITAFIMDMTKPGVEVRPLRLLTGDAHFNEVFFTDVRISDSLRIGEEGRGWEVARTTLGFEHSGGDPDDGIQGGVPGRSISSLIEKYGHLADGQLRERLVDAWIDEGVGRVLSAMLREQRSTSAVPGADGSLEKVFHSEHRQRVQELLIDLGGAAAVAYPPDDEWAERSEWAFLRTRTRTIAAGTSEIHRNKIAERLLGLPRDDAFKGRPWNDVPKN